MQPTCKGFMNVNIVNKENFSERWKAYENTRPLGLCYERRVITNAYYFSCDNEKLKFLEHLNNNYSSFGSHTLYHMGIEHKNNRKATLPAARL